MYQAVGVRHISPGVNSCVVAAAFDAGAGAHPAGRYPSGGFFRRYEPMIVITKKMAPSTVNVVRQPYFGMSQRFASGPKIADPPPYPATASPTARPRLSGNHFAMTGIGVE